MRHKLFKVAIFIGNDQMMFKHHIARALKKLAEELEQNSQRGDVEDIDYGEQGLIKDLNGNEVGQWRCTWVKK
jgi:hypothetical protein